MDNTIRELDQQTFAAEFFDLMAEVECGNRFDPVSPSHVQWPTARIRRPFAAGAGFLASYSDDAIPIGFAAVQVDPKLEGVPYLIFIRDEEDKVVGGIIANLFGGWAFISLLWVEESLRGRGYGTELLSRLETEAVRLGCSHAHVDTYSFEARPFHEKSGYEVLGTLENYPEGHCKYFLKKRLVG